MKQGFGNTDELKIAIIMKRLTPAVERRDQTAFAAGIAQMQARYGESLVDIAATRLTELHPWIFENAMEQSPDLAALVTDHANEVLADVLEEAGLRLEDHFRVSDQGIALTHKAVNALAKTNFPKVDILRRAANDSMSGMGIKRAPFIHPLSEAGDEHVNLWLAASVGISVALGWGENCPAPEAALTSIRQDVARVAPNVDFERLLRMAKYDDRALLRLCSLVRDGIEVGLAKVS